MKTPRRKNNARKLWLDVHLYVGLILGLIISVVGLTGSLLVFYVELDEMLNPELVISNPAKTPLPYETIFQSLRQTEPERQNGWRLEIPENPQRMMTARYYTPQEIEHSLFAPLLVSVNPYSGEVVKKRFWGEFAMTWIYDLHYTLLLKHTGKIVMAIVGGFLLVSLLSGVYLWLPARHKIVSALLIKRSASRERFTYDLHKVSGIYSLIVMLMLTITGIALEIPEYANPLISCFSPLQTLSKSTSNFSNQPRISLDKAVDIAKQQFPDARLCWIETPSGNLGSYRINLRQANEPSQRFPKTNVWIDQYSGDILNINNPRNFSKGDSAISWFHPLHSGEAFSMTGRLLVFISGLCCPILFVTGVLRWLQKRCAKSENKKLS